MFTPPPSPRPFMRDALPRPMVTVEPFKLEAAPSQASPVEVKRSIGRRIRWTVLLVPCIVILITASTRYLLHPKAFDIFSEGTSWETLGEHSWDWTPHKRHPIPRQLPSSTSSSSPSSTTAANGPIPTVPSSDPGIPTPFPQPFDDLTQNYSSTSCFNFFSNMTNTAAFRSCRPLALLIQSSSDFTEAQANVTLLNTLIWGTCNTTTAEDQCTANMGWFASALQTSCAKDLQDQNSMALTTLTALQAYSTVRDTGCLSDPTTNTYCYLNAVRNANPSELYIYNLPIGLGLPKTSTLSCSSCTRSAMGIYSKALDDPALAASLSGLKKTYSAAADLAVQQCGAGYAVTKAVSGAASTLQRGLSGWTGAAAAFLCASYLLAGP